MAAQGSFAFEGEEPAPAYQFRYRMYAAAHGLDCEAMLAADDVRWPGGLMAGFIIWIGERWNEFGGDRRFDGDAFDAWLESEVSR